MPLATIITAIDGLSRDQTTRNRIRDLVLQQSAIEAIRPADRLTSLTVNGLNFGNIEAHVVNPGETKFSQDAAVTPYTYQAKALAVTFPMDLGLYQSEADVQAGLAAKIAEAMAIGVDREVLRNTDGKFATSLVAAATAASNVVVATSDRYADLSALFGKVEASGYANVNGLVLRSDVRAALRTPNAGGNVLVSPSDVFGVNPQYVSSRVLPMSVAVSETMAVAGDFSQLEWGIWSDLNIKYSEDASMVVGATTYNAFTQNLVLVRAEMYFGFSIVSGNAFAVLNEVAS